MRKEDSMKANVYTQLRARKLFCVRKIEMRHAKTDTFSTSTSPDCHNPNQSPITCHDVWDYKMAHLIGRIG